MSVAGWGLLQLANANMQTRANISQRALCRQGAGQVALICQLLELSGVDGCLQCWGMQPLCPQARPKWVGMRLISLSSGALALMVRVCHSGINFSCLA